MFDPTKPVQTREGQPARIVSAKGGGYYPLLVVIDRGDGSEYISRRTLEGKLPHAPYESDLDLVNVPEEAEEFWNAYLDDFHIVGPKETIEEANADAGDDRSFTLKLTRLDDKPVAVELLNVA